MKKVILLAAMMPLLASAQVSDDFESGELTGWIQSVDGRWEADASSAISGMFSLHHVFDNPEAGNDCIAIEIRNFHPDEGKTNWSFTVRHGYEPSSSNNWMVFLMGEYGAGITVPATFGSGFAIGVNITGSDDSLKLVKISAGKIVTIVNCGINWQTDIGITMPGRINVERSGTGEWKTDVLNAAGELIRSSGGSDPDLFSAAWFGINYRYSATKDRLLWIDDVNITGVFYADTEAPYVVMQAITGRNSLELILSEEPSGDFYIPGNFSTAEGIVAASVEKTGPLTSKITFPVDFINKKANQLIINDVCDRSGNCSGKITREFTLAWAETGDIVITEIMADPTPSVSLPESEYIEITNRTAFTFNLKDWELKAGEQSYKFGDRSINPYEIIILCRQSDVGLFSRYGSVWGFSTFPSLTDAGRLIYLLSNSGMLIHGVEYSSAWYKDEMKSAGGWSLEMIDIDSPFYAEGNWKVASSRAGGTPGKANSVSGKNPDVTFQGLVNVFPEDSSMLMVRFSEPVPGYAGILHEMTINGKQISDAIPSDPLYRNFLVTVADPLRKREKYAAVIPGELHDFANNRILKKEFVLGFPETAEKGDVLFNELLFNPLPGNVDFIEFFNTSGKTIDASRLFLVSIDDGKTDTSALVRVSEEQRCIMPGSYYAITTEKEKVAGAFISSDSEFIFNARALPSMPDNKGHLLLLNRELDVIDEVFYNEKMHFALLSGFEGISLEKTAPELRSDIALNWHSASESSGWATPGKKNSVVTDSPVSKDQVALSSSRITPDSDGLDDFLSIHLKFQGIDNVVSASVFDESGNLIRRLTSNFLSGPESILLWDGTAEDGSPARTGIYVILINYYDKSGHMGRWKKVCTVIRN